jgi:hypothetical protein
VEHLKPRPPEAPACAAVRLGVVCARRELVLRVLRGDARKPRVAVGQQLAHGARARPREAERRVQVDKLPAIQDMCLVVSASARTSRECSARAWQRAREARVAVSKHTLHSARARTREAERRVQVHKLLKNTLCSQPLGARRCHSAA